MEFVYKCVRVVHKYAKFVTVLQQTPETSNISCGKRFQTTTRKHLKRLFITNVGGFCTDNSIICSNLGQAHNEKKNRKAHWAPF